jgi:phosphotransferase system enzyme I (PtsI)
MVLEDPELIGGIHNAIESEKINAEAALKNVTDTYIGMFEAMADDNPYMAERAADIRDVTKRVLAHLLGKKLPNPALIQDEVVIIAKDMTPSDTAQLDRKYVKGFITDLGGRTAHAAIMARTLEIPAVVGSGTATAKINEGDLVILDGLDGQAIVNPTDEQVKEYTQKGETYLAQKAEWAALKNEKTVSADGKEYRTEFLYMDSQELPTEDDQFEAYKTVLAGMDGKPVTIRTMDIGGDKYLPYMPLPEEENPFMGYRAIRISLDKQDIFRTQLRALLRASVYGNLWIMFPMIATLGEFRQARSIFNEEKEKLIADGVAVADDIKLGIMIEIPAAAMLADKFAQEVDFFSIGTNDLIAYTMAADRGNEHVAYLYQPYNPSIMRLIKNVIDAAHKYNKFVAMCGEMAGDQIAVPILMGLGLDEFSMSATSVLQTRSLMKRLSTAEMAVLAEKALDMETNDEVKALVEAEVYDK